MSDATAANRDGLAAHPKGLAYLAATELAERFSYYGMTGLLALYLVKQLLLPDHAAQVLGLAPLRASLALFSTDFDDLQVSTFRNGSFVILNAARARSRLRGHGRPRRARRQLRRLPRRVR